MHQGLLHALVGLEAMVKRLRRAGKSAREAQRQECLRFAAAIIDAWKPAHAGSSWRREEKIDRNVFPGLLCELDDPDLLGRFLENVLAHDPEVQLDATFVAFSKRHGWSRFEREFLSLIKSSGPETLVRNAERIQLLCRRRDRDGLRSRTASAPDH